MKSIFRLILILLAPLTVWAQSFQSLYQQAIQAQNSNQYEDFLAQKIEPQGDAWMMAELVQELESLKQLPAQDRMNQINELIFYYSEKHGRLKQSALQLDTSLGPLVQQMQSGTFSSQQVAQALLTHIKTYEKDVVFNILGQIETQIQREYPSQLIFCIGRDFTPGYLFFKSRGKIPAQRLFTLNVSRAIRDRINEGSIPEILEILAKIGITKDKAVANGVLFLDSSMSGKIPGSLMRALTSKMNPQERYQFFTRSAIRYLRAKDQGQQRFAELAKSLGQMSGQINDEQMEAILKPVHRIDTWKIQLPQFVSQWDAKHQHNVFEHRPKFLQSAKDFGTINQATVIDSSVPQTPGEKIRSILGLMADMTQNQLAGNRAVVASAGVAAPPIEIQSQKETATEVQHPLKPLQNSSPNLLTTTEGKAAIQAIAQASQQGYETLKALQKNFPVDGNLDFSKIQLVQNQSGPFPFSVYYGNQEIYRLKEFLGEGRNVKVYRTEAGTALKILKKPEHVSKQFMLAWASQVMQKAGIPSANVLGIYYSGVLLEQELVDGRSLEQMYGFHRDVKPPKAILDQVNDAYAKALKLTQSGFWLDFKSANFHVDPYGHISMVDYTPRLNKGHKTYFYNLETEAQLTTREWQELFFYKDAEAGKTFRAAPVRCTAVFQ